LIYKLLRNLRRSGRHHNGIKWRFVGPTAVAIAPPDIYISVTEQVEPVSGGFDKTIDKFDGIDLFDDLRKYRRLIA
jgi:hypothetical protein